MTEGGKKEDEGGVGTMEGSMKGRRKGDAALQQS